MQEKHIYEYAVIRFVPRVEREEFLNIGVILFCKKKRFLEAAFTLDEKRLHSFSRSFDFQEIENNLRSIEKICLGGRDGGPIGKLDIADRFRWLTATRSTIIQCSKVHPGFCVEPGKTLLKLHKQLVLEY
ncbi:DUF3037 domain-containing protein [Albibacterium sp.]|uniref:DUF3037 domain-containing protein n=1 Tax=Albibacterium sp. TaxID=2952885 RepID=UPI002BAB05E1|nr:DUF3037 domain-containing protein [Albibacterium sp.]HUH19059.1 DUF3037 domain-containing protein [Albibacterium sp.]